MAKLRSISFWFMLNACLQFWMLYCILPYQFCAQCGAREFFRVIRSKVILCPPVNRFIVIPLYVQNYCTKNLTNNTKLCLLEVTIVRYLKKMLQTANFRSFLVKLRTILFKFTAVLIVVVILIQQLKTWNCISFVVHWCFIVNVRVLYAKPGITLW